jgi:hypothetical protein
MSNRKSTDPLERTPFIGREDILSAFDQKIRAVQPGVCLMIISGEGGIGKTRVVQRLLEKAREDAPDTLVAAELVDLYHIHLHTREGLMRVLAETLPGAETQLPNFFKKICELDAARLAINGARAHTALAAATEAFLLDMAALSRSRRLVLAFDTAERWVYNPMVGAHQAEAWGLLIELAKCMENAVILLAGRPRMGALPTLEMLAEEARQAAVDVEIHLVKPFSQTEAREYVNAALRSRDALALTSEEATALWTLTEGRPISLALFLDNYLFSARDRSLRTLLDQAHMFNRAKASWQERQEILTDFENKIINRIMSEPGMGAILTAIGRAPKGVDSQLLAAMLKIEPREASQRLNELQKLVFIKEYQFNKEYKDAGEPRFFLHDLMYDLLRSIVFADIIDVPAARESYQGIKRYYLDKIAEIMDRLSSLYNPQGLNLGPVQVKTREISEWEARRRQAYCELVYYSLRLPLPFEGMHDLCRYSHEAVLTNSLELIGLLTQELTAYLAGVDANPWADEQPAFRFFAGHMPAVLEVMGLLTLRKFDDAILQSVKSRADILRNGKRKWKTEAHVLACILDVWRAYALASSNRQVEALVLLPKTERDLDALDFPDKEWLEWFRDYALALLFRVTGYCHRLGGEHALASACYGQALQLFRKINFKAEQANTLNDNGFAQAEQGKFFDAEESIDEGLKLRRELGLGRLIGLSLSTKAMFKIRQGEYRDAIAQAGEGYRLFEPLGYERGVGLALIALAEASRRLAAELGNAQDRQQAVDLLRAAREYAESAVDMFVPKKLDEVSREVEALIEKGCALRDRLRLDKSLSAFDVANFSRQSEGALGEAAGLAKEQGIIYRQVDALVNLAWLRFTQDHATQAGYQQIQVAVDLARKAFAGFLELTECDLPKRGGKSATNILWAQYGKLFTLEGNAAIEGWLAGFLEEKEAFPKAARAYLLGLEYNRFFGEETREMRQVKHWVAHYCNELQKVKKLDAFAAQVRVQEKDCSQKKSYLQDYLSSRGLWPRMKK